MTVAIFQAPRTWAELNQTEKWQWVISSFGCIFWGWDGGGFISIDIKDWFLLKGFSRGPQLVHRVGQHNFLNHPPNRTWKIEYKPLTLGWLDGEVLILVLCIVVSVIVLVCQLDLSGSPPPIPNVVTQNISRCHQISWRGWSYWSFSLDENQCMKEDQIAFFFSAYRSHIVEKSQAPMSQHLDVTPLQSCSLAIKVPPEDRSEV